MIDPLMRDHVIGRLLKERARQELDEGWTAEHDDRETEEQLARAAACYALPSDHRPDINNVPPADWPWPAPDWRPSPNDRLRELEKAGALIIAEMERLLRVEGS